MSELEPMNDAYAEFFDGHAPARITIGCSALAFGALVEVDCVAVLAPGDRSTGSGARTPPTARP